MSLPPNHVLIERLINEMVWIAGHWRGLADEPAYAAAAGIHLEQGHIAGLRWAANDLIDRAAEIHAVLYASPDDARPALRLVVDNEQTTTSRGRDINEIPHRPDR